MTVVSPVVAIIAAVVVFSILVGLFITLYTLNKKIPKPDVDLAQIPCNTCKIGCGFKHK